MEKNRSFYREDKLLDFTERFLFFNHRPRRLYQENCQSFFAETIKNFLLDSCKAKGRA